MVLALQKLFGGLVMLVAFIMPLVGTAVLVDDDPSLYFPWLHAGIMFTGMVTGISSGVIYTKLFSEDARRRRRR